MQLPADRPRYAPRPGGSAAPTADSDRVPAPVIDLHSRRPRLSILYAGQLGGTCLQRANALRDLGHDVVHVRSGLPPASGSLARFLTFQLFRVANRIKRHPDFFFANRRLLREARGGDFDVVWIDKGLAIRPRTLRRLRERLPNARLITYSPDDMFNPDNQSARYLDSIPLYDLHVTTKSYNVAELRGFGARDVVFVDNAYDPAVHRPVSLSAEERRRFAADVAFVGAYELERAEILYRLAASGIPVTVRGPGWRSFRKSHPCLTIRDEYLDREDYARAVCASKINLGFLRRVNRDLQTTRSVEIPACGGFLLAERTDEHMALFREGVEAEFFGGFDELRARCVQYLADDAARERIARAGQQRCESGGYSNQSRLSGVLTHLLDSGLDSAPRRAAGLAGGGLGVGRWAVARRA